MPLVAGDRLGPYTIAAPVGSGGMGEVYRAHDPRLGRDVAVKIISSDTTHEDRLWRFEQEARAVAALNHPNIIAIYDVETGGSTPFLVTELLEGESLRQRIDKARIPPRKARDIAEQIAQGLAAAHDKRIAHRDLKPDNVFVTTDGRVKILDFGLAKLASPVPVAAATVTAEPKTAIGTVMGTVGYMSPEQVRGLEADHRSDIFSLGTVLYEMLSGRRLFAGDTSVDTMSAILHQDPPELPATADVPAALQRIVRRCVEKNPDERFQSARDLAFALSALADSAASAAVPPARTHGRLLSIVAIIAAALVIGAGAATMILRGRAPALHPMHFTIPVPGEVSGLALSRDGTRFAFVTPDAATGKNMLYVQRIGASRATVLPGTEGASYPFWSPDATDIGFFADGRLQKIRASGGPVQTIVAVTSAARGGSWSAKNVIVYAPAAGGPLWRVNADGTGASALTEALLTNEETSHRWPAFLPDGDRFVFWGGRFSKDSTSSGIFASSLAKGAKTRLVTAWSNAGIIGDRALLYVDDKRRLAMQSVDPETGVAGDAHVLADVVGFEPSVYWGTFAVSDTGTVIANPSSVASQSVLTWYDRAGTEIGTVGGPATMYNPTLSPDGRRIAVDIADKKEANVDVWLLNAQSGTAARFTFDPVEEATASWSPDGTRVVYGSSAMGLELKSTSGFESSRTLIPLPSPQSVLLPDSWSPDGKYLVAHVLTGTPEPAHLFLINVDEPTLSRLLSTTHNETTGQISPDGRWLAYASDESGEWNVYVTTFPAAAGKWQVSVGGGTEPRWRGDGKELFYIDAKSTLTSVAIEAGSTFASGPPQPLFRIRGRAAISNTDVYSYDVTRDGTRFIVNKYVRPMSVPPLEIFLNATAPESPD
jgi:Tol biopolymer transport system component